MTLYALKEVLGPRCQAYQCFIWIEISNYTKFPQFLERWGAALICFQYMNFASSLLGGAWGLMGFTGAMLRGFSNFSPSL
jgi:hypothetical protein